MVSNIIIYYIREGWSNFRNRRNDDERLANLIEEEMEMEEREGLTPEEIGQVCVVKLPSNTDTCLICFEDFKKRTKIFEVAPCGH